MAEPVRRTSQPYASGGRPLFWLIRGAGRTRRIAGFGDRFGSTRLWAQTAGQGTLFGRVLDTVVPFKNAAVLARSIVAKELDELVINTADHPYQLEADEIEEIIETDPELPFSWLADADGDD